MSDRGLYRYGAHRGERKLWAGVREHNISDGMRLAEVQSSIRRRDAGADSWALSSCCVDVEQKACMRRAEVR